MPPYLGWPGQPLAGMICLVRFQKGHTPFGKAGSKDIFLLSVTVPAQPFPHCCILPEGLSMRIPSSALLTESGEAPAMTAHHAKCPNIYAMYPKSPSCAALLTAQKQMIMAHVLCAGLPSDPALTLACKSHSEHPWLNLSRIRKACPALQVRHITTQDP